ncbi:hypothetical protein EZV62_012036 [Acer yangbiense]|uniref:Probable N-acetyl-gamma-glutamyl-phosphate reductase, chloroplastic n=1 Tax=Acer yangbiense TaxID=1000413 RepID=A0A5C7I8U3_9ROSI|nr:hypothetical protein EZV62_012036 [Acer yangbiense]
MDNESDDNSGTDDDLPPSHQNRIPRGGHVAGNGRFPVGSVPYPRMYNDTADMETQIYQLEQEAYSSNFANFGLFCLLMGPVLGNGIREWRQAGGLQCGMHSINQAGLPGVSSMKSMQYPSSGPAGRDQTRWPDDNNFYEAVITDYNPVEGQHERVYNIGTNQETWEWVNLSETVSARSYNWWPDAALWNHVGKKIYSCTQKISREVIKNARLVANPGCYPTSIQLPLVPLIKANLIEYRNIIIDAKSGVSGAGRGAKEANLYSEIAEGIYSYGVTRHRHAPEIEQGLSDAAHSKVTVSFTPHLMPMILGMQSTIYVEMAPRVTIEDLYEQLKISYKDEEFVKLLEKGVEGEDPGISHQGGDGGPLYGNRFVGRDIVPGTGSCRGVPNSQSRKDFLLPQNGIGKRTSDDIQICHTARQVERVFGGNHPDPVEIERAKKVLKEQEQALIARLADIFDGESGTSHSFLHNID